MLEYPLLPTATMNALYHQPVPSAGGDLFENEGYEPDLSGIDFELDATSKSELQYLMVLGETSRKLHPDFTMTNTSCAGSRSLMFLHPPGFWNYRRTNAAAPKSEHSPTSGIIITSSSSTSHPMGSSAWSQPRLSVQNWSQTPTTNMDTPVLADYYPC